MKTEIEDRGLGIKGIAWALLAGFLVVFLAVGLGVPQSQIFNARAYGQAPGVMRNSHSVMIERYVPRQNWVHIVARHKDGTIFSDQWVHNLRVNAGINWQYNQMAGTSAAVCTYLALSNDSGAPAAGDTAVASEITGANLARANATPTHTTNATSYTLTYTWTANANQSAQKAGMLNAVSAGTLCFENTFLQVSMASGDTLAVTWTVNF